MTTITQADREAAADWYELEGLVSAARCINIRNGLCDENSLVEKMAAHREAAEARARLEGAKAMQEVAARVAEKRADDRFAEHGTTESCTNASYYSGRRAEALDELDEEDWAIRDAIAALDPAQIAGGGE